MKWKVTAPNMVEPGEIQWEVDADSQSEAFEKGIHLALTTLAADTGMVDVEPLEEDRPLICERLKELLQLTRGQYDLEELTYNKGIVTALYRGGGAKTVDVAGDSGVAMIMDIVRCIW